ncbi:MAG: hypothetical protein AAB588_06385 [Patescibacteria group bacterium]
MEDIVLKATQLQRQAELIPDSPLPEDPITQRALREKNIKEATLRTALKLAICLNNAQLEDEKERDSHPENYQWPNLANNAWQIFVGMYQAETATDSITYQYKKVSADPHWKDFLEANGPLVKAILALVELHQKFNPVRLVAIGSFHHLPPSSLDTPTPIEMPIDTIVGYARADYFVRSRMEPLIVEALKRMRDAGMENPDQYTG